MYVTIRAGLYKHTVAAAGSESNRKCVQHDVRCFSSVLASFIFSPPSIPLSRYKNNVGPPFPPLVVQFLYISTNPVHIPRDTMCTNRTVLHLERDYAPPKNTTGFPPDPTEWTGTMDILYFISRHTFQSVKKYLEHFQYKKGKNLFTFSGNAA